MLWIRSLAWSWIDRQLSQIEKAKTAAGKAMLRNAISRNGQKMLCLDELTREWPQLSKNKEP